MPPESAGILACQAQPADTLKWGRIVLSDPAGKDACALLEHFLRKVSQTLGQKHTLQERLNLSPRNPQRNALGISIALGTRRVKLACSSGNK